MKNKKYAVLFLLVLSLALCIPAKAADSANANSTSVKSADTNSADDTNPLWPIPPQNEEEQRRYDLGLPPKYALGFPNATGEKSPLTEETTSETTPPDGGWNTLALDASTASSEQTAFTDVAKDAYYAKAVAWAVQQGITNGTTATTFSPANTTTRGHVMTFLWRWAGKTEPGSGAQNFSDVAEASYCHSAVRWAVERNVTKGTTDTTFSPNDLCSYGHVLTFLWRFMGSPDPAGTGTLSGQYAGRYYQKAVEWAEEQGLLADCLTGFSPVNPCPRADVVQFLYRMGRLSVADCLTDYTLSGLYDPDGKTKAVVTVDMVTSAELWTYGTWNDRPGEHGRMLSLTEDQAGRLIWVVSAKTPYHYGGLPSGGPLTNAALQIVFNARTGDQLQYGVSEVDSGKPDKLAVSE